MRRNTKMSEKVLKAISLGLAAMMTLSTPIVSLADETVDDSTVGTPGEGEQEEKDTPVTYKVDKVRAEEAKDAKDATAKADTEVKDFVDDTKEVKDEESAIKDAAKDLSVSEADKAIDDVKGALAENGAITEAAEKVDAAVAGAKAAVADAENIAQDINNDLDSAKDKISNLNDAIENAASIEDATSNLEQAEEIASDAETAYNDAKTAYEEAEANYTKAQDDLKTAQDEYDDAVKTAQKNIETAQKNLQTAQDALVALEEQVKQAQQKYEEAVKGNKEKMGTEAAYNAAVEAYNAAKAQVDVAQTELENVQNYEKANIDALNAAVDKAEKIQGEAQKAWEKADAVYKSADADKKNIVELQDKRAENEAKNNRPDYTTADQIFKEVMEHYVLEKDETVKSVVFDQDFTRFEKDDTQNYIKATITKEDGTTEERYYNYVLKNKAEKDYTLVFFEKTFKVDEHYEYTNSENKVIELSVKEFEDATNKVSYTDADEKEHVYIYNGEIVTETKVEEKTEENKKIEIGKATDKYDLVDGDLIKSEYADVTTSIRKPGSSLDVDKEITKTEEAIDEIKNNDELDEAIKNNLIKDSVSVSTEYTIKSDVTIEYKSKFEGTIDLKDCKIMYDQKFLFDDTKEAINNLKAAVSKSVNTINKDDSLNSDYVIELNTNNIEIVCEKNFKVGNNPYRFKNGSLSFVVKSANATTISGTATQDKNSNGEDEKNAVIEQAKQNAVDNANVAVDSQKESIFEKIKSIFIKTLNDELEGTKHNGLTTPCCDMDKMSIDYDKMTAQVMNDTVKVAKSSSETTNAKSTISYDYWDKHTDETQLIKTTTWEDAAIVNHILESETEKYGEGRFVKPTNANAKGNALLVENNTEFNTWLQEARDAKDALKTANDAKTKADALLNAATDAQTKGVDYNKSLDTKAVYENLANDYKAAKAAVEKAQTEVGDLEKAIDSLKDAADVSKQIVDDLKSELDVAKANLGVAEKTLNQIKDILDEARENYDTTVDRLTPPANNDGVTIEDQATPLAASVLGARRAPVAVEATGDGAEDTTPAGDVLGADRTPTGDVLGAGRPQTGDYTNTGVALFGAVASGMMLLGYGLKKKKEDEAEEC